MQTISTKPSNYRGEKKISVYKAMVILAKNNIIVEEEEAAQILDFLYHMAKTYSKTKTAEPLGNTEPLKSRPTAFKSTF